MSLATPRNTLAYHLARPVFRTRDIHTVPCSHIAGWIAPLLSAEMVSPAADALRFYALNHLLALVKARRGDHEPLPENEALAVALYTATATEVTARLFAYALLTCVGEAHLSGLASASPQGVPCPFLARLYKSSEDCSRRQFVSDPPEMTLGTYFRSIDHLFAATPWGGGMGGALWAGIARHVRRFIEGEISGEVFSDGAWSLKHNGGPMFNKSFIYTSVEDLKTILDAQASGRVLQLVRSPSAPPDLVAVCEGLTG